MYDTYRKFIYKNKNKFNLDYRIDEDVVYIVIDLDKSYAYNKKQIDKAFLRFGERVPGVWVICDNEPSIKGGKIEYYEVLSTADMHDEMLKDLQFIYLGIRDAKKNIYNNFRRNVYRRYKYQQIYKRVKLKTQKPHHTVLIFKQVVFEPVRENRENIELKVALDKEAVWWSSNPHQARYIQRIIGVSEDDLKNNDGEKFDNVITDKTKDSKSSSSSKKTKYRKRTSGKKFSYKSKQSHNNRNTNCNRNKKGAKEKK